MPWKTALLELWAHSVSSAVLMATVHVGSIFVLRTCLLLADPVCQMHAQQPSRSTTLIETQLTPVLVVLGRYVTTIAMTGTHVQATTYAGPTELSMVVDVRL